jgi:hypothetical protein
MGQLLKTNWVKNLLHLYDAYKELASPLWVGY